MNKSSKSSLGEGVFYAESDYAGFFRRLAVIVVDLAVLMFVGVVLWNVFIAFFWYGLGEDPNPVFWISWPVIAWVYLAVIKPSSLRSVGYRLTGLKIVNMQGTRPSVLRMSFRLLLWLFAPFNLLYDLMWIGADTEHRSLRDCYSGTCVVRKDAQPIGRGPMRLAYYAAFGLTLMYPSVARPQK